VTACSLAEVSDISDIKGESVASKATYSIQTQISILKEPDRLMVL
jgi:hypothetical protein